MFRDIGRSVRTRVLLLMLASTLVALIVAVAALIVYDVRTDQERWINDLTTQAEILGRASVAALAFNDPRAAKENLDLLKVRPQILAAAIYSPRGELFATYSLEGSVQQAFPEPPFTEGARIEGRRIILFRKIIENHQDQGTVYIRARYELLERVADYMSILAVVFVLSMLAALIMSAWMQRAITRPITDMTGVARQVMESRDFSLRVRKTTDDEIGFLVDSFNNMLAEIGRRSEALLAADRMKDQFLATLAHELRNPLAPISNALHLLEVAGERPEIAAEARRMMARQLRQMVRLVDDLLDVSRITTGKLVLHQEKLELHKVIESAIELARPLIDSCGHRLTVELPREPVHLEGDETRLAQVFSNLLNNAAKFTERGGEIALRAEAVGSEVRVSVTDNGAGMPAEVLPNIFNMFTQVNTSGNRPQTGLGVGLALSLHLVQMHGGSIEAHSEGVGHGSRFTVRLPTAAAQQSEAQPVTKAAEADVTGHRVLVVDDNLDFATSLATILREMGNDVRVEHDGVKGLRAAWAFEPAIAFVDIGLPGMSGYDLARQLRDRPRNGSMLLIAVTGWGQDADKRRAREAGFDDHVVKPLDPAQIPAILARAAESRGASRLAS